MKAITLWQPWATLMAHLFKRNETRDWGTDYRGPLAIHAAKAFPDDAILACRREPFRDALVQLGYQSAGALPRGCIVAVGTIADVLDYDNVAHAAKVTASLSRRDTPFERSFGNYGPGRKVWVTQRMVRLPEPVECRGAMGLWTVPPEIATAVLRQLVRAKPSSHVDGSMAGMVAPPDGG